MKPDRAAAVARRGFKPSAAVSVRISLSASPVGFSRNWTIRPLLSSFNKPECGRLIFAPRDDAHGNVGISFPVALDELLVVHAVELVSSEDQLVVVIASGETMKVLADSVGCSLKPVAILHRLFRRKHFNEALTEFVEAISQSNVAIERRGIVLGQNKHPVQSGVDGVAYRNIDKAVLPAKRELPVWIGRL